MGRHAEGWKLVWRLGTKVVQRWEAGAIAYVRFTHKETRYFLSTGEGDPSKADAACARGYSDVIQRGAPKPSKVALSREALPDVAARWLASVEGVLDPKTARTYEGYVRKHFLPSFADLSELIELGRIRSYVTTRLRVVLRTSLQKELSALRGFLTWCRDEGYLGDLPEWVALSSRQLLPAKAAGRRSGPQRAKPNELSVADVEAFIDALPEMSERSDRRRKDSTRFPIKARFVVAYETGLRPATLDEALWSDLEKRDGRIYLVIRDEMDKARWGRDVPLTARAAEALDNIASRNDGKIFGQHDYRTAIRKACVLAGISLKVAPYDFRHARATHLLDAGASLTGVAFLHGHRQVTTTNRYTAPSEKAAAAAIALMEPARPVRALPPAATPTKDASVEGEVVNSGAITDQEPPETVRRRGLEPLRELPRWNLNPPGLTEAWENKACEYFASRHDSAEISSDPHDSGSLIRNRQPLVSALPTNAGRALVRYVSGEWAPEGALS